MNAAYYRLLLLQQSDLLYDGRLYQEIMCIAKLLKNDKVVLLNKLSEKRERLLWGVNSPKKLTSSIDKLLDELIHLEKEIQEMDALIALFGGTDMNNNAQADPGQTHQKVLNKNYREIFN